MCEEESNHHDASLRLLVDLFGLGRSTLSTTKAAPSPSPNHHHPHHTQLVSVWPCPGHPRGGAGARRRERASSRKKKEGEEKRGVMMH
jgi:hypothetical protein